MPIHRIFQTSPRHRYLAHLVQNVRFRCICFTHVAMITVITVFISETTRKNVALDKNTFASSSIVNHRVLVDGRSSDRVKIRPSKWVGVDLGQTEHVDSVQVYFQNASSKKCGNLLH